MSIDRWTRAAVRLARARRLVASPLWRLVALAFARPIHVRGRDRVPAGPVVFAANHASHADTVVLLAALRHRTVLPAAAADYFFATRTRGAAAVAGIGAFPFPREGRTGLARVHAVLATGHDVLLFPQGTRDGGPVRSGVGRLAAAGATVVPVHLDGTDRILPKGARRPRRHAVTITIGAPVRGGTPVAETVARVAAHLDLPTSTPAVAA